MKHLCIKIVRATQVDVYFSDSRQPMGAVVSHRKNDEEEIKLEKSKIRIGPSGQL